MSVSGAVSHGRPAQPVTQPEAYDDDSADTSAGSMIGKFTLGDVLGRGGMGVVVQAVDLKLERVLAIKQVRDANDHEAIAWFVDEAQITGQLEHPNIVPVHELGEDGAGRPWMAMKLVHGQTLSAMIGDWREEIASGKPQRLSATDIGQMLEIIRKVADAISFAHSRHVIHRDLKSENVMLGAFGEVLVMDWGLAKPLDASPTTGGEGALTAPRGGGKRRARTSGRQSDSVAATAVGVRVAGRAGVMSDRMTMQGDVFGTPAFMPPEQARGEVQEVGPAADQFALAGILYHMLTLEEPYRESSLEQTLAAARQRQLPPPHLRASHRRIPRELSAIVMKAMAARPRDRYPDIGAFIADCNAWQAHERTTAYRQKPWEALGKWFRRHPTAGITGVTTVLMLAVFGALAWSMESSRQLAEHQAAMATREAALAEAEERAATARAHQDRIALAVRNREFEQLYALTGERLVEGRDTIMAEFAADWHAWQERQKAAGNFPIFEYFSDSLDEDRVRRYLELFKKLFAMHRQFGVPVTADDWLRAGSLKAHPKINDFRGALDDFNEVLRIEPHNVQALIGRGGALSSLGNSEGAYADYSLAIQLSPTAPPIEALLNRSGMRTRTRDYDGALADARAAIEAAPDDPRGYRYAGLALSESNRHHEAIAFFNKAIERKPDYVKALAYRGRSRMALGQHDEALEDFDTAAAVDGGNHGYVDAWLWRSNLHNFLGNSDRAIADMEMVASLLSRDPHWRVEVGKLRLQNGDPAGAIKDCDTAIAMAPQFERGYRYRGRARAELGQHEKAIADFTQSINFSQYNAEAYEDRGDSYFATRQIKQALADYEVALRWVPDNWEMEMQMAMLYAAAGRLDETNTAYLHAWRNCDDPAIRETLAQAYRMATGRDPDE